MIAMIVIDVNDMNKLVVVPNDRVIQLYYKL